MKRLILTLIPLLGSLLISPAQAQAPVQATAVPGSEDTRQLVAMPAQARSFMRQDMLQHLTSLNEILGLLAAGQLREAGELAETSMGKSAMGKHRGSEMAPGRYMPLTMRNLAWGMHGAASDFARITQEGDQAAAYSALQKVTASCVACHNIYRTQ